MGGRTDGREDDCVTTKISWMHRETNFLTHGALLRALRALESSATEISASPQRQTVEWCRIYQL